MSAPAFGDLVTGQGWVDRSTLEAMAADVLAWGERPHAFFAMMGVTALGWVESAPD